MEDADFYFLLVARWLCVLAECLATHGLKRQAVNFLRCSSGMCVFKKTGIETKITISSTLFKWVMNEIEKSPFISFVLRKKITYVIMAMFCA
jgi:hypothetical protein